MPAKELYILFENIDRNINFAIDRLDLNLLSELMDNRESLMRRCVDENRTGHLDDEQFASLIEDVRRRGVVIQARLNDKLRLVKRELKRMEAERETRKGYLRGGGYRAE